MKKINVGFFGTRGLGNYGGFETIGQKLNENLDEKVFNFFVSKEVEQNIEYQIQEINSKTKLILQNKTWMKKYSKELDNIINEGKILKEIKNSNPWKLDVVFQCGSTPGLLMGKYKENKTPLIFWNPDGLEWKRAKFPKYAQLILYYSTVFGIKNSHAVTVDSKSIAQKLKSIIKKKPTYYLPSGANITKSEDVSEFFLEEYKLKKEGYYIIVARAVPENHVLEILENFEKIETTKKLLVVCNFGEDDYSQKCLEIIKKSERLIYKGPVYDEKKLNSLRFYSFAYLHGHSVGGTNPSLLEALGNGNPCICYGVNYNKEVALNAGKYFVNFDELRSSILELENNKVEYEKMKENAIKIIKENFSWSYIAELHEAVTMHSLLEYKRIGKSEFELWLNNKVYKEKLVKENFGRLD